MQRHEPRYSMTVRGTLNRFSNRLTTPRVVLSLLILAILTVFVVMPFTRLVRDTLVWQGTDIRISRDAQPGTFTTFHWERTFDSPLTKNLLILPLIHSLEVGVSVAVLALVIGGFLAWLIVRTDMPFKKLIGALAVIPYVLPSYTLALAWIIVFKNERIGGAMGLFQYLTGISPPNWLSYGYVPIVINLAIHYSPFAYLLISGALASIDSRLEESAELLGATRWLTLRRITLPIVLPAILSAFILVFSRSIGIFGTPYF
ncbi:iron ABC transporter permease, partial [Candidatus Bipolaricaulota bacterium]|nr:iron ABC transporter permease [Candidatus Bipolaricaulota bacterium]